MSNNQPSLTDPHHPQWNHGRIRSLLGKERKGYIIMAVLWNALAQPMFLLTLLNNPDAQGVGLAVMGLFPLIGLGLAWIAAVKWLQWKRFGKLELVMDPFPAAPGGDAGGMIELPIAYHAGKTVDITLSCINVRISRSSKSTSHHETVLWRERARVAVEPGMRGSRVRFRFLLPDDMPTSTEPSNQYTRWVVHLQRKLPGADLDQTFEIPVLASATPLQSRGMQAYSGDVSSTDEIPMHGIAIAQSSTGLSLHYPASRGRSIGLAVLVFGLIFALVPGFMIVNRGEFSGGDAFNLVFFSAGAFFALVFGIVALSLILFGLYTLLNRLYVSIEPAGITSTRYIAGFRFTRTLAHADIDHLHYKINAQQGQGARATAHYLLEAVTASGKPVCLGDGIRGKPLAQKLMCVLGEALHIDDWREHARRNSQRTA